MFGAGFGQGSSRVPLHTNVFNQIGRTGGSGGGKVGAANRDSALLGTAQPSNRLSGYYARIDELKSYQLLDITKLATSFFNDYCLSFLKSETQQAVTILKDDGATVDEEKTERLNEILLKDLKIFDFIQNHNKDSIYFGEYVSLLCKTKDELGHLRFRFEELYDPISVVTKKTRDTDGTTKETYLARGEDGKIYEIPEHSAFILGSQNLRLINDLEQGNWKGGFMETPKPKFGKVDSSNEAFDKVISSNSYLTGEPLFYSLVLKVKELVVKELLISLISMRDISSLQLFLLSFDKSTPLETANELCARTTKLTNNTNELASFMTSQFDVVSFIENTLSQSAKFIPDYNQTLGGRNYLLPLDKLSDKLPELMSNLDYCKAGVLNPLGIPSSIVDSTSGSKWTILQNSERANSKVTVLMDSIKSSVLNLTVSLYNQLYNEDIDPSLIKLHISEKTSVEYNNQINQSESVSGLMTGISNILATATNIIDGSAPLINTEAFLSYIQNLIKDIDPNTESIITKESLQTYVNYSKAKFAQMAEQNGIDINSITPTSDEDNY